MKEDLYIQGTFASLALFYKNVKGKLVRRAGTDVHVLLLIGSPQYKDRNKKNGESFALCARNDAQFGSSEMYICPNSMAGLLQERKHVEIMHVLPLKVGNPVYKSAS